MKNNTASNGRGVESFLARYGENVIGVLSGFDRLRLQGTLRTLYRPDGMARFLERVGEPWKNFKAYMCELTGSIRSKAEHWAKEHGRQSLYLRNSSVRKEEVAREIISREKITAGPVAMMSAVEPCRTWVARGNRQTKHLELKLVSGKCIHLYFYVLDPDKGLIHLRLQSWFPFLTQVCLNGREWLACQMRVRGMRFEKSGNCFTSIEDLRGAQGLIEQQATSDWRGWLDGLVAQCHPMHAQVVAPLGISYYWSAAQSEYATDLMFSSTQSLAALYERVSAMESPIFRARTCCVFWVAAMLKATRGKSQASCASEPRECVSSIVGMLTRSNSTTKPGRCCEWKQPSTIRRPFGYSVQSKAISRGKSPGEPCAKAWPIYPGEQKSLAQPMNVTFRG